MKKIKYLIIIFLGILVVAGQNIYINYKDKKQLERLSFSINLIESKFNCDEKYLIQLKSMQKHLVLKKEKIYKKSFQEDYLEFERKIKIKCNK